MQMITRKKTGFAFVLCAVTGVVSVCAPFIGMAFISLNDLAAVPTQREIFFFMRVPRVLTALCAGSGLALAGMVFQAVFRNPMATPFTLGIASGASCGAATAILFGFTFAGRSLVSAGSFFGACIAMGLVYGFSVIKRDISNLTLLLAGIAISFVFSSLLLFLQFLSHLRHSFQIVRWLMGGIDVYGYSHLPVILVTCIGGAVIIFFHLPHLDQLVTGETVAHSRGVDVTRTKLVLYFTTSLMVAGIVSVCGPIGFVGIMSPHICRLLFGNRHLILGPVTLLFGGTFLTVCDTIARTVVAPAEIPVGVITALLGGPFFLWILLKKRGVQ